MHALPWVFALATVALDAAPADGASQAAGRLEALAAIEGASELTLLTTSPSYSWDETGRANCIGWCYHEREVHGAVRLQRGEALEVVRRQLVKAFHEPADTPTAMCFLPRHGVRVVAGHRVFDFVACFECGSMEVVKDRSTIIARGVPFIGEPESWDRILEAAGIVVPPPPKAPRY